MHGTRSAIFGRNKAKCYCQLIFPNIRFFKIVFKIFGNMVCFYYDILQLILFYFHLHCFHFRYNYWFIIIFFSLFKKVPNIPNYSASDCFIFLNNVIFFFISFKLFKRLFSTHKILFQFTFWAFSHMNRSMLKMMTKKNFFMFVSGFQTIFKGNTNY